VFELSVTNSAVTGPIAKHIKHLTYISKFNDIADIRTENLINFHETVQINSYGKFIGIMLRIVSM